MANSKDEFELQNWDFLNFKMAVLENTLRLLEKAKIYYLDQGANCEGECEIQIKCQKYCLHATFSLDGREEHKSEERKDLIKKVSLQSRVQEPQKNKIKKNTFGIEKTYHRIRKCPHDKKSKFKIKIFKERQFRKKLGGGNVGNILWHAYFLMRKSIREKKAKKEVNSTMLHENEMAIKEPMASNFQASSEIQMVAANSTTAKDNVIASDDRMVPEDEMVSVDLIVFEDEIISEDSMLPEDNMASEVTMFPGDKMATEGRIMIVEVNEMPSARNGTVSEGKELTSEENKTTLEENRLTSEGNRTAAEEKGMVSEGNGMVSEEIGMAIEETSITSKIKKMATGTRITSKENRMATKDQVVIENPVTSKEHVEPGKCLVTPIEVVVLEGTGRIANHKILLEKQIDNEDEVNQEQPLARGGHMGQENQTMVTTTKASEESTEQEKEFSREERIVQKEETESKEKYTVDCSPCWVKCKIAKKVFVPLQSRVQETHKNKIRKNTFGIEKTYHRIQKCPRNKKSKFKIKIFKERQFRKKLGGGNVGNILWHAYFLMRKSLREQKAKRELNSTILHKNEVAIKGPMALKIQASSEIRIVAANSITSKNNVIASDHRMVPEDEMVSVDRMVLEDEMISEDSVFPEEKMASEDSMLPEDKMASEGSMIPEDKMTSEENIIVVDVNVMASERNGTVLKEKEMAYEEKELASEEKNQVSEKNKTIMEENGLTSERNKTAAEEHGMVSEGNGMVSEEIGMATEETSITSEEKKMATEIRITSKENRIATKDQVVIEEEHVESEKCSMVAIELVVSEGTGRIANHKILLEKPIDEGDKVIQEQPVARGEHISQENQRMVMKKKSSKKSPEQEDEMNREERIVLKEETEPNEKYTVDCSPCWVTCEMYNPSRTKRIRHWVRKKWRRLRNTLRISKE